MTSVPLDPRGDAGRALATAVEDFGPRALSSPVVLANLFKDLLPDSPRETTVLVAVAEAGLAKAITDRVEQGLPPESATYQAATIVADARAMDPAAVHWAARQFASVLGYNVPPSDAELAGFAAGGTGTAPAVPGWPAPVAEAPGWQTPGVAPATPLAPGTNPWEQPVPAWPEVPGQPAPATTPGFVSPADGGPGFGPPGGDQGQPPPTVPGAPGVPLAPGGFPPGGTPISVQPTEIAAPAAGGWGAAAGWAPAAGANPAGVNPPGGQGAPPAYPPNPGGVAPGAGAYGAAPVGPPGAAGYNPPPAGWTPASGGWTPPPGNETKKSRTPWYLGGAAVVAVIAAIIVVVAVSSGGGGKKSPSAATTTIGAVKPTVTASPPATQETTVPAGTSTTQSIPSTTTTEPATTVPQTTAGNLTGQAATLAGYLPIDFDPQSACQVQTSLPDGLVNTIAALGCTGPAADTATSDPGLPGGDIFAYQFKSVAAFQAGLTQYNKDKAFDPTTAGNTCPPASSTADGAVTWNNPSKTLSGDLECFTVSDPNEKPTMPVYIWTITSANAIVEAVGSSTTTFAELDDWFLSHNSPR